MFETVLIANRGEIARRIARTCRERGIRVAVVYSDPDADSVHVAAADYAVHLPGSSAAETYLNIDAIIDAAHRVGADALHPGYGFLAENADLAQRCVEHGITFIGPAPQAIRQMGSKVEAKRAMAAAGVPLLPSAELNDGVDPLTEADRVGYPLLIKASAGGGGKAMRIVEHPDNLQEALASCRREAAGAFGDDTVFLERYLTGARHIEIQVFGDQHGAAVHLGERECSVQRRYQKIIEESPSPAVGPELRAAMGEAAVAAVRAIDYVGAGTIEFLVDDRSNFYFLEMNTRLQVEHPVTELVTRQDLVWLQLLVAAGEPLPDLTCAEFRGHAIEARLYAEDVDGGFLPASGSLRRFEIPPSPGLRVDAGVTTGSRVSIYYDPMLAKVIAYGKNRDEAADRLAQALRMALIDGVTTNADLLAGILAEPDFRAGRTHTGYLSDRDPVELAAAGRKQLDGVRDGYALAATLACVENSRQSSTILTSIPVGFRCWPAVAQRLALECPAGVAEIKFLWNRDGMALWIDDRAIDVRIHHASPDRADLTVGGVRRAYRIDIVGEHIHVRGPDAALSYRVASRFPASGHQQDKGGLIAPMPGTVVRVLTEAGAQVQRGDALVIMEAMKMEHQVCAHSSATVTEVLVSTGDQVEAGQVVITLDGAGADGE